MYFDSSIAMLRKSLSLRPDHVSGMFNLALLYIARGTIADKSEREQWFSAALEEYQQILKAEATTPEMLLEVGRLLSTWAASLPAARNKEWIAVAIQVLRRALEISTNDGEHWRRLGTILVEVARRAKGAERVSLLDGAIQAYERATGKVADRSLVLLNLGVTLMDRGRDGNDNHVIDFCTRAIALLEEYLLSNPQDTRAHSGLGLALFTRACASNRPGTDVEYRQASSEFRQALVLNGRSPEMFENALLVLSPPQPVEVKPHSRRYAVCQILALLNDADHCLDEIEKLVDEDTSWRRVIASDPIFQTFLHIARSGTGIAPEQASGTMVQ
jgi:Flp pilus assembly protein TadD